MSKERLEEIKEDVFKCNHGDTRGYSYEQLYHIALSLVRIHGEWLIEQAERVQEYEYTEKYQKQLIDQNKRYRETVEEAVKDLENECLWDALIKLKALEVEK